MDRSGVFQSFNGTMQKKLYLPYVKPQVDTGFAEVDKRYSRSETETMTQYLEIITRGIPKLGFLYGFSKLFDFFHICFYIKYV